MMKKKKWTKEDDQRFIELYTNTPSKDLTKIFNCSYAAIKNRANTLNVKKSGEYMEANKPGQYRKGNIPLNKGKKMKPELYNKVKSSMFKKGHQPHNTKHDGAISIRKDKRGIPYKFIRTKQSVWIPLHRYVWEKQNGPIPKNHNILFKDGDTLNVSLDNLIMVDNKELMEINSLQNYPEELRLLIHAKAALSRQINKKLNNNE